MTVSAKHIDAAAKLYWWARDAQSGFDLGADRDEFEQQDEFVEDDAIGFGLAVVADRITEQAAADADTWFGGFHVTV